MRISLFLAVLSSVLAARTAPAQSDAAPAALDAGIAYPSGYQDAVSHASVFPLDLPYGHGPDLPYGWLWADYCQDKALHGFGPAGHGGWLDGGWEEPCSDGCQLDGCHSSAEACGGLFDWFQLFRPGKLCGQANCQSCRSHPIPLLALLFGHRCPHSAGCGCGSPAVAATHHQQAPGHGATAPPSHGGPTAAPPPVEPPPVEPAPRPPEIPENPLPRNVLPQQLQPSEVRGFPFESILRFRMGGVAPGSSLY